MKKDVVSIIVPVYKTREQALKDCIRSLQSQTYKKLEILLIDDGSPDNCGAICDSFAKEDNRIRVVHQKNSGVSGARNHGLELAEGEYLGFADADDCMRKNSIETAVNAIRRNHVDCAVFSWIEEKESKEQNLRRIVSSKERVVSGKEISRVIAFDDIKMGGGYPWNKIWRSEAIRNNGEFIKFDRSLYAYEDKLWILQCLKEVDKVVLLPDILYLYRFNPLGLSKDGDLWEYRILNTFDAYQRIADTVSYDPKSLAQARVYISNFAMGKVWPAWVYRRFNMGYFQRIKVKYYQQGGNIRLAYTRGWRNALKYLLLKVILLQY